MHIIEYIGKDKDKNGNIIGVKSTEVGNGHGNWRMETPRIGDVIEYAPGLGYPFDKNYGRVDQTEGSWCKDGYIHICCDGGSFFWGPDYVSVSGGPFQSIKRSDLKPTYRTKTVSFWNWGDNLPGAAQGVYYQIERPVFLYDPELTTPTAKYVIKGTANKGPRKGHTIEDMQELCPKHVKLWREYGLSAREVKNQGEQGECELCAQEEEI